MKLVHWQLMGGLAVTFVTARRGLGEATACPAQAPPCCTKCDSLFINGQCTNHCIAVKWSVV